MFERNASGVIRGASNVGSLPWALFLRPLRKHMIGGNKMRSNIIGKILTCFILIAFIGFVSFFFMIAAAFSGGQKFYIPIICTIAGVLVIFIFLRVFRFVKPKVLYWMLSLFFYYLCFNDNRTGNE